MLATWPGTSKILIFAAIASLSLATASARDTTAEARKVLELTKTTTATYSNYVWNKITKPGETAFEEGSAEFHSGYLHRVETPRDRIVADCRAQFGSYLSVGSGEIIEGPNVSSAACGINGNASIISIQLLGRVRTKFGDAKRVRVIDTQNVREYDVSKEGVLLRTTYKENRPGGALLIVAETIKLERTVPEIGMFDKATLSRGFLPTKFEK